ncbi:PREDICTED: probable inactive leucine-rich repeat receptor-like protein kinase At3g03770 isoform X1 [Lupinus angustifolius]|uniref:probable inactive leucine-rich repeat receptor-like protein kinase At3g03770 isoform X1 n=1 Tax=Lupinus angustifolius TaxID=3871 RepID=UPI00092F1046|nr:PREDICTED: probable inactive leucine-rich repeat receptor-like protein kinase At3g03770 isoform X1 [Lupinus angustifolius]
MAKLVFHSQLLLLILFLAIHVSEQLEFSQSETLVKVQNLLGYPSVLSSLNSNTDYCNIEPTTYFTLVCYEDNLTQLHVVGNNDFTTPLPQNFNSETLFDTLGSLSSLKVLSLVSLGLWGPLPGSIAQLSSLEILNISSNYFSGIIPAQLSYLRNLQSMVLDDNNFNGQIPSWVGSLQGLAVLSMKNNFLSGNVPTSVNGLQTLRVLDLSSNQLLGVPNLHNLANLQVLQLANNTFGPHFPSLPTKLVSIVLRNNSFRLGIPSNLSSFYQLQKLDLSLNGFVGPFLPSLLSLPSINYLDISSNKLTGMLFNNLSCNDDLHFVNLSSNLLKGELPTCLKPKTKVVLYAGNCLSSEDQDQHPSNFCNNEALAVKIIPHQQKHKETRSKSVLVSSVGGVVGSALIVGLVILVSSWFHKKHVPKSPSKFTLEQVISQVQVHDEDEVKTPTRSTLELVISQVHDGDEVKPTPTRSIMEHIMKRVPDKDAVKTLTISIKEHVMSLAHNNHVMRTPTRFIKEHSSSVNTAKLLTDARYISQTMKMGASLPAYRTFAFEELKEATNNFDASCFISEGPYGQIYKGVLSDGMHIAIRGLKMRKRHSPQSYMHHVELISKLRHSNLVSALGHSFECSQDDSSVSTIFLIFEFVPNRILRSCVSGSCGEKLSWTQRIAAAIGVGKGIQFLHTGIVPGLYSNNLKITDTLLDNNLNVKINSYNLPLSAETKRMASNGTSPGLKGNVQARIKDADKNDVYDIGVILLEIILGRPIMFHNEVGTLKDLLQVSIKTDDIARRSIVDPAIHKECSDESLMKMMEICVRCLSTEPSVRPSVEDVLWNLQFAAQVQNSWKRDSNDNKDSPTSPSQDI